MKAYIGFGSNLGDRHGYINRAVKELNRLEAISVDKLSDMIETPPLAGMDQPPYINAVASLSTTLGPEELFQQMQAIEDKLERTRDGQWQPRTIDLDLLVYKGVVLDTPELTIPHHQMHLRSFVLDGMCQLAPRLVHPTLQQTMTDLALRLNGKSFALNANIPQLISIAGIIGVGKTTLASRLAATLGCPLLREAYDTNPYMPEVYAGKMDLALKSQLYFLDTRLHQLSRDNLPSTGIFLTDYIFDKDHIFAARTVTPTQFAEYCRVYRQVASYVTTPVLVIHLKDKPQAAMERIHKRNRPYEQKIKLKSLKQLAADYKNLFDHWDKSPVITISVSKFNCMDPPSVAMLAAQVERYICRP